MNKNLKAIQLIDSLNPGGAEMMAVNIANELANEQGIESHLCTTRLEGDLKVNIDSTVGYLFLHKKRVIDIGAIIKLYSYIKKCQITIIHAHSSSYFIAFLVKLLNPKLKLVWQDHYGNSENLNGRNKFLLIVASYTFDTIISVNKLLLKWAEKYLKAESYLYLPNFASFNSEVKKKTFLKGDEHKRIVCLANLRPQKDHLNLLKAFNIVNGVYPKWSLHLIGKDLKDEYAEGIKSFIKLNYLSNHVFLYGSCNDVEHILKQATIGVLASKSEGLPVALLEYGLAKLPVVVTNVGECDSVVENGISGIVVHSSSETMLAKCVVYLIQNKEDRLKYGENLQHEIKLNYSKMNYIKKLHSIYKSE